MGPNFVVVRTPGKTIDRGLRIKDRGEVDVDRAHEQHEIFCRALGEIGYRIVVWMDANDDLPDSVFVEDPAVIISETLVLTRLTREERRGEECELEGQLSPYFRDIQKIKAPGFVEGGDVLVTNNMLYIGLSKRTNLEGAGQLARIAHQKGYGVKMITLPNDHLHLKGEAAYHPNMNAITVTLRLAPEFSAATQKIIEIPVDDGLGRFGANCISKEDKVITTSECPTAVPILQAHGFTVLPIDLSEFNKIDGAMSCLCKLF